MAQRENRRTETPLVLRDADRKFWSDVTAAWYARAYALAVAQCDGDKDAAHEVIQATFLALPLAHARGRLAPKPEAIFAWFRITIHWQAVMYYRRQRPIVAYDPVRDTRTSAPEHECVDDRDEIQVLMRKVWRAIAELEAADREMLLSDMEAGLTRESVMNRYKLTSTAYRQRKSRALKRIRNAVLASCA